MTNTLSLLLQAYSLVDISISNFKRSTMRDVCPSHFGSKEERRMINLKVQIKFPEQQKRPIHCAQDTSLGSQLQYSNVRIKREIKKYLKTNENKNMTHQSLWDTGEFIVIYNYIKIDLQDST